jgi:methyl coenzyme M reductase subunit D
MVNTFFKCISKKLLLKNYDNAFNNWISYIYNQNDTVEIICSSYAPLKLSYEVLNDNQTNKKDSISLYIDYNTALEKYNFYLEKAIKGISNSIYYGKDAPLKYQLIIDEKLKNLVNPSAPVANNKSNVLDKEKIIRKPCNCGK